MKWNSVLIGLESDLHLDLRGDLYDTYVFGAVSNVEQLLDYDPDEAHGDYWELR